MLQFEQVLKGIVNAQFTAERLSLAANPIQFCVSEEFLDNKQLYDFKGSYQVMRDYFNLRCPICNSQEFEDIAVSDKSKEYLESEILLEWDSSEHDFVCPKCRSTQRELVRDGVQTPYNTLVGVAGMGSGKTSTVGQIAAWMEHFLIVEGKDMRSYFGLDKVPFLELVMVATAEGQAARTIWAAYKTFREMSPWFAKYNESMKSFEKLGMYSVHTASSVKNDITCLHVESLASNSASLAGRRRVGFIIDELARFDTTESKRSAAEVWRVGDGGLALIRAQVKKLGLPYWLGSMFAIGSPISVDDFLMRKYNAFVRDTYKFKATSQEFNPVMYKKEDFDKAYEEDPIAAERDFGANPPGAELPWIDDWTRFRDEVASQTRQRQVEFKQDVIVYDNDGREYVSAAIEKMAEPDDYEHVICGDAGRAADTYGLVSMHYEREAQLFVLDWAIYLRPDKSLKRLAYFPVIEEIIDRMAIAYKIVHVSFDYWNNESMIQNLRMKHRFTVEQYAMSSVRVDDFMAFRRDAYMGRVKFPFSVLGVEDQDARHLDGVGKILWEAKRMQRSKDLKRVDHSVHSTSDLIESVVNAHRVLMIRELGASSEVAQLQNSSVANLENWSPQVIRMKRWGR